MQPPSQAFWEEGAQLSPDLCVRGPLSRGMAEMHPGGLWKCTPSTPGAGEHTHITLSLKPFSLEGMSIPGHPKARGAPPLLLSHLRLDREALASREGSWRMDSLERTLLEMPPKSPLADVETPVPQEGSDLRQRMGRGHHSRADVALSFFLEAPG